MPKPPHLGARKANRHNPNLVTLGRPTRWTAVPPHDGAGIGGPFVSIK